MKYKLASILLIIHFQLPAINKNDSTSRFSLVFGTHIFLFNKDVLSPYMQGKFIDYQIKPFDYFSIGAKFQKNITHRKQITLNGIYTNSKITYLYNPFSHSPNNDKIGNIQFNSLLINTYLQYKILKWLKVNYGFSNSLNLKNRFDDVTIAKEVNWYNDDGKSKMKKYSFAVQLGFETQLYKNLSLEFNTMQGLNTFLILGLKTNNYYEFPQKLIYHGLTLNYKIR
jgi:hypothetical protein